MKFSSKSMVGDLTSEIASLRSLFAGQVIVPDDPGYDAARRVFSGAVDRRPQVIIQPADPAEVARVVTLARERRLPLAVRGGGHSAAGHGVCDDGILLDLGNLRSFEVDAESRTAWAGAGLTAAAYTESAAAHGLATGLGDNGAVGIGGHTLGGGVGLLSRKQGLTIDNLLAAEIVTADGQLRRVDATHDPQLFWAIRGGGGNFGVVTRLHFQLHPVSTVVGGVLVLPATAETLSGFVAAAEAAPEELTTVANVMPAPPMPFLPPELHGQLAIVARMCFAGNLASADQVLAPFRALATPLADQLEPMPYPRIFPPDDPDYRPKAVLHNMFLDHVDDRTAGVILEHLRASDAAKRVAQLRVFGGAVARVPADATAYAHRDARIMVHLGVLYDTAQERTVRQEWLNRFAGALVVGEDRGNVNFMGDDGTARLRAAYPGDTWDRLVQVKNRYDPGNLFRLNHNIPPQQA